MGCLGGGWLAGSLADCRHTYRRVASSGHAGVLTASWTAPTTHTDGSALTNLALYRVYYDASDSPCPGSTFVEVAAPESSPSPDETVSFQLTSLTTAVIYTVSVTAVDTNGNESTCSDVASAVAQDDSATGPVPDTTTPTVPDGSATTPNGFCPPGQAKKGLC
jgi:hypothetical protein